MLLRAGIDRRHDQSGLCKRSSSQTRGKKMPLLFYLPLIIWMRLLEVAQGETRSLSKLRRTGDSTMTERDNGLNSRKVRMGRLVEAQMALICGKVITWFVSCRL